MSDISPRDKTASRDVDRLQAASADKAGNITHRQRDIDQPNIIKGPVTPMAKGQASQDRASPKTVFIKTYGCQMNVYDSERMADVLAPIGYAPVDAPDGADLVVLNTCHIREKAAEKVYSELGRIRKLKEAKSRAGDGNMTVAVAGCVAQAEGEEIMRRAPVVDMVLGPQTYHKLPEMIARVTRQKGGVLETDFDTVEKFDDMPTTRDPKGYSAFLTVQEGCDKFCTFCVVPYTRGAEVSRPVEQIVAEARDLARKGVREITLIGQNVDAYHAVYEGKDWRLGHLIRHVAKIGGIERLRFTTSHPRDMDEDLIRALGDEEKLMPYLHLPIQSGSDKILRAMNRQHTYAHYRDLIGRIRDSRPDIALSGDFIVGFPGETDADFEQTLSCVDEIGYASSFSFKYSVRPGTPGASMPRQVPEDVKQARLETLQKRLYSQQEAFNKSLIGRTLDVLVEDTGREAGQLFGRSPYLQGTHFTGDMALKGAIVPVTITDAGKNSLIGTLAGA